MATPAHAVFLNYASEVAARLGKQILDLDAPRAVR
jgi:hypothetical protein